MKPITFSCESTLPQQPEEIASQILHRTKWSDFDRRLRRIRAPAGDQGDRVRGKNRKIVGTRIRVTNRDGSTHAEEIVERGSTRQLCVHMHEFSPPVSRLATAFDETWEFERVGNRTHVVRSFKMHPKSAMTRPLLWLISCMLKRAISRHLKQMAQAR